MEYMKHKELNPRFFLSIPFIYGMAISLLLLDLSISIFHHVAFRLYNIPLVNRKRYFRYDRHTLTYLNWYQKLHCAYCSYANGLLAYSVAIVAETEKFWCGIMNEQRNDEYMEPTHHREKDFLPYGDVEAFKEEYPAGKDYLEKKGM